MGDRAAALLFAALGACGGKATPDRVSAPVRTGDDAGVDPAADGGANIVPDGGTSPVPDGGTSAVPDGGVTQAPDAGPTRLAVPEAGSLYHGVLPYAPGQNET